MPAWDLKKQEKERRSQKCLPRKWYRFFTTHRTGTQPLVTLLSSLWMQHPLDHCHTYVNLFWEFTYTTFQVYIPTFISILCHRISHNFFQEWGSFLLYLSPAVLNIFCSHVCITEGSHGPLGWSCFKFPGKKKKKKIKQLSVAIREISVWLNGRQKEDILHQIYIYPFKTDTRKTDK